MSHIRYICEPRPATDDLVQSPEHYFERSTSGIPILQVGKLRHGAIRAETEARQPEPDAGTPGAELRPHGVRAAGRSVLQDSGLGVRRPERWQCRDQRRGSRRAAWFHTRRTVGWLPRNARQVRRWRPEGWWGQNPTSTPGSVPYLGRKRKKHG